MPTIEVTFVTGQLEMEGACQAIFILIDNSFSSLNGDFVPTRLDAERSTVDVLARNYLQSNRESAVGFGTMGGHFGVEMSLTRDLRRLRQNLDQIKRDGTVQFERSVKCAIYALRHRPKEIDSRRLIILLGSAHNLTEDQATSLAAMAVKEGVEVDLLAFGEDVSNIEPLKKFCEECNGKFYSIGKAAGVLCDIVQQELVRNNSAVVRRNTDELDEDIRLAIQLSLETGGANIEQPPPEAPPELPPAPPSAPSEVKDPEQVTKVEDLGLDIDLDDPELLAALSLSLEQTREEELSQAINEICDDDEALQRLLADLPGVDLTDPQFSKKHDEEKKDDNEKKDDGKN
jgi:26S proteasome regulatory subunit N10